MDEIQRLAKADAQGLQQIRTLTIAERIDMQIELLESTLRELREAKLAIVRNPDIDKILKSMRHI
jgi:Holliday junction resolvase RusA-like endonuclease